MICSVGNEKNVRIYTQKIILWLLYLIFSHIDRAVAVWLPVTTGTLLQNTVCQ